MEQIVRLFMETFMDMGMDMLQSMVSTILTFMFIISSVVCGLEKIILTPLCRGFRQWICKMYSEEDPYDL